MDGLGAGIEQDLGVDIHVLHGKRVGADIVGIAIGGPAYAGFRIRKGNLEFFRQFPPGAQLVRGARSPGVEGDGANVFLGFGVVGQTALPAPSSWNWGDRTANG